MISKNDLFRSSPPNLERLAKELGIISRDVELDHCSDPKKTWEWKKEIVQKILDVLQNQ